MDELIRVENELNQAISAGDLLQASRLLDELNPREVTEVIERSPRAKAAVTYRLLSKSRALEVFEMLDPAVQGDLVHALRDDEVTGLFSELDPDDRAQLVDELPASVAQRLMLGLSAKDRAITTAILGYRSGSVGRRMSPEYVHAHPWYTAARTLDDVRAKAADAETIYTIPVTNDVKRLVGIVSLREVLASDPDATIGELMSEPEYALATDSAEEAARTCADHEYLALPIVDSETRLLGILTVDDAHQILRDAEAEDVARAGGSEPLRRPYLSTSIFSIARSRVVWLLVLAVSALLTVQVLEIFEATLEQKVVLALFIPLLTGTGGNTGSQAATTITRALAVGDVRTSDVWLVLLREVRVGTMLGLLLGSLGFVLAALVYDVPTGAVIGLTLLCVCAMAATVGGAMPLLAKTIHVDPAVFSTPFITTFCDATGLLIYFTIAKAILQI
ncbi:magnesium transporter [Lysinibacter cavernae]|uniref:Magnesium transporter MgtE n=1 Tax=Lysinibacter cavernae TaxID=1640652 RepID=A0A7X5R2R3_9MICO|nr:magnesium transporter [Lysinibacter cavernae]NIH54491.1 magnesium transporter [Lysinibacter cavernae]